MAYEQKDGQGALFKNERKEKETHPDYRGDCKLDGKDYWISAWLKKGPKGTFMSLALQPKEDKDGRRQGGKQEKDDGDIPF